MERIRVLLVDDHPAFLSAAAHLLAGDPMIDVVAALRSPREAMRCIATLHPDIVLLELEMSEMSGLLVTLHVKAMQQAPLVVIITDHDQPIYQDLARGVQADGFVAKRDFHTAAVTTIKTLCQSLSGSLRRLKSNELRVVV